MDYRKRLWGRFERRTWFYLIPRFPQYGVDRYARWGYWGVRLWSI